MIKIFDCKKENQNEVRGFIIRCMKTDLVISNETLKEITRDLDDIYTNYIKSQGEMLYAFDDESNQIVGTIAMVFENDIAMLKRFYVDKNFRNQKIGFLLYQELEKRIISKNIKEMYLTSGYELTYAHRFYEKNGWTIEEKNPGIKVRKGAFIFRKSFI